MSAPVPPAQPPQQPPVPSGAPVPSGVPSATLPAEVYQRVAANVARVIRGKPEAIRLALTALFAEGHLLVEDVPGVGKTTLARCIAHSVDASWNRIQFTPDLLPGDITGVMVYHQGREAFEFHPGGIFANVVVADEINRGTPKTQSALLEVMAERRVTVDAVSREVPAPFIVVATQNPIEMEGTYRLPEAQLDRFMMRIEIGYPDHNAEVEVVVGDTNRIGPGDLSAVVTLDALRQAIAAVRTVHVDPAISSYAVRLAAATREHAAVRYGASPRGSIALVRAAQAYAATEGRPFCTPDDVKGVARPVLAHRLVLTPDAELNQRLPTSVVDDVLSTTAVPTASSR